MAVYINLDNYVKDVKNLENIAYIPRVLPEKVSRLLSECETENE